MYVEETVSLPLMEIATVNFNSKIKRVSGFPEILFAKSDKKFIQRKGNPMYILPGYTTHYEENGAIYVSSKLLQNKVMLTEPDIQEEFRTIVKSGGCPEISTPLTKFLHEQELLLNNEEIRTAVAEVKNLLNNTLMLTIMPTEGCNFRCPYCYEVHRAVSMFRDTLDRIQEYITEQASRFPNIHISWFGGEPTLCKDVILETNALVQELQEKHQFHFTSSMTTNGYLLDAKNFQEYYAAGITDYQITLDGWGHDKIRPHVSGGGTLQTILDNLVLLASLDAERYPFHITLRRNILANDMDFTWYDHLYDLFGNDKRFFMLVVPVGDWGGKTVKALDLQKKESKKELILAHKAYIDKIGMQWGKQDEVPFSNVCYASYPYGFVFRPNGKIEKCTVALDHPKNLVGTVDPDKGVILDEEANRLWSGSDLKSECSTCPSLLSCLNLACRKQLVVDGRTEGGCPYDARLAIK